MRVMSVSQAILVRHISMEFGRQKWDRSQVPTGFCVFSVGKQGRGATNVQSPASWVSGVSWGGGRGSSMSQRAGRCSQLSGQMLCYCNYHVLGVNSARSSPPSPTFLKVRGIAVLPRLLAGQLCHLLGIIPRNPAESLLFQPFSKFVIPPFCLKTLVWFLFPALLLQLMNPAGWSSVCRPFSATLVLACFLLCTHSFDRYLWHTYST